MTRGNRVIGDKKMPAQRMTVHWAHNAGGRMYWCRCMPCFRVGKKTHAPRRGIGIRPMRSVLTEVIYHKEQA